MGKQSRLKGQGGERELAGKLRELLEEFSIEGLDTTQIRRGLSQTRGGGQEEPDVVGVPGVHPEVKRQVKVNYRKAFTQASEDARDGHIPIVFARDDHDTWKIHMEFVDFVIHFLVPFLRLRLNAGAYGSLTPSSTNCLTISRESYSPLEGNTEKLHTQVGQMLQLCMDIQKTMKGE